MYCAALSALWLKPDYLHREGWGTDKEDQGGLGVAEKKRLNLLTYGFALGNFPSLFGIVEGL